MPHLLTAAPGPAVRLPSRLAAVLALLAASAASVSCGATVRPAPTDAVEQLIGETFTATSGAIAGIPLIETTTVTVTVEPDRLRAHAGCNTIAGPYEVEDGGDGNTTAVRLGEATMTQIGCPPGYAAQDERLATLLRSGLTVTGQGESRALAAPDGALRLTAQRAVDAPPLIGTRWQLVTIVDRAGTASSVPRGLRTPTFAVAPDATVTVTTGCNGGGGRATVAADQRTIAVDSLFLTEMACRPSATAVEQAFRTVLQGGAEVRFDGEQLVLANGGDELHFRAG